MRRNIRTVALIAALVWLVTLLAPAASATTPGDWSNRVCGAEFQGPQYNGESMCINFKQIPATSSDWQCVVTAVAVKAGQFNEITNGSDFYAKPALDVVHLTLVSSNGTVMWRKDNFNVNKNADWSINTIYDIPNTRFNVGNTAYLKITQVTAHIIGAPDVTQTFSQPIDCAV